jgi:hypothetical protein
VDRVIFSLLAMREFARPSAPMRMIWHRRRRRSAVLRERSRSSSNSRSSRLRGRGRAGRVMFEHPERWEQWPSWGGKGGRFWMGQEPSPALPSLKVTTS